MSLWRKLKGRIALTLFALVFAAVGVAVLSLWVLPSIYDGVRMQGWTPVDAILRHINLETHTGKNSATYSVQAQYEYQFEGRTFSSSRVAIYEGADNIGDFQQELGKRLSNAFAQKQMVTAYVNADNPAEAVLSREFRWGFLLMQMIFLLAFGGIGFGLLWYVFFVKSDEIDTADESAEPWLSYRPWQAENIVDNSKQAATVVVVFAVIWNLISVPAIPLMLKKIMNGEWLMLLVAIFPIIGLLLLRWAWRLRQKARRYGQLKLQMDPYPGAIGGHIGGQLLLPGEAFRASKFKVKISCVQHQRRRNSDDSQRLVWQSEGFAQTTPLAQATRLQFRFVVPNHLPASEKPATTYHQWMVDIHAIDAGEKLSLQFEIPVFATAATSAIPVLDSTAHPDAIEDRLQQIDQVSDEYDTAHGRLYRYPPGRHGGTAWLLGFMGLVFFVAAVFMFKQDVVFFMWLLFGGVGSGLLMLACYLGFNQLDVLFNENYILVQRRLFGFRLIDQQLSKELIKHLEIAQSYTSSQGNQQTVYYNVRLRLHDERHYIIGDGLKGRETAIAMMEQLAQQSGLAALADGNQ